MIPLFDTHCHFDLDAFDPDRHAQWRAAMTAGVNAMVIPSVAPSQWQHTLGLSLAYPNMYVGLGVHPHWISSIEQPCNLSVLTDQLLQVGDLLADRFVAIGECGLDGLIDVPLSEQREWLNWHLELSSLTKKPLIVHCVKAHNEALAWIGRAQRDRGGVIHAFSGSYDLAMQWIDRGFKLGVGGVITYERAKKTRDALSRVPLEALVLETDAPDMPLCGYQGERNTPSQLPRVLKQLAILRNMSAHALGHQMWKNSVALFGITNLPCPE